STRTSSIGRAMASLCRPRRWASPRDELPCHPGDRPAWWPLRAASPGGLCARDGVFGRPRGDGAELGGAGRADAARGGPGRCEGGITERSEPPGDGGDLRDGGRTRGSFRGDADRRGGGGG